MTIGRLDGNAVTISDTEVSSHHVSIRWDPVSSAWLASPLFCGVVPAACSQMMLHCARSKQSRNGDSLLDRHQRTASHGLRVCSTYTILHTQHA